VPSLLGFNGARTDDARQSKRLPSRTTTRPKNITLGGRKKNRILGGQRLLMAVSGGQGCSVTALIS